MINALQLKHINDLTDEVRELEKGNAEIFEMMMRLAGKIEAIIDELDKRKEQQEK